MANNPSFLKDLAEQSLSSTAGKDLLDRLQKAEAVVEAAKEVCYKCPLPDYACTGDGVVAPCVFGPVKKILDDLEG